MALARVQKSTATSSTGIAPPSITTIFTTPPTAGNGIIVFLMATDPTGITDQFTSTCRDSAHNDYLPAGVAAVGLAFAGIWYLPKIAAGSVPASVTVTFGGSVAHATVIAVEVSGVVNGLKVHASAAGTHPNDEFVTANPTTGPSQVITYNDVFVAAVNSFPAGGSSVLVLGSGWTQEVEQGNTIAGCGEADTKVVAAAAGTTQSASWLWSTSGAREWAAVLVVFVADGGEMPPPPLRGRMRLTVGFTIDVPFLINSLHIDGSIAAHKSMTLDVLSRLPAPMSGTVFRPAIDQRIWLEDLSRPAGTQLLFGGMITAVEERGTGEPASENIITRVDARDFSALPERRYATFPPTTSSVKYFCQLLVDNYLSALHITLDQSMGFGSTLTNYEAKDRQVSEILDELVVTDNWQWFIDDARVLHVGPPATAETFALTGADVIGDLTIRPNNSFYANTIRLRYGHDTIAISDERWQGDGTKTLFPLRHKVASFISSAVTIWNAASGGVEGPGGGFIFSGPGAQWWFDTVGNQLVATTPLTAAQWLSVSYFAQYPETLIVSNEAEVTAHGIWELVAEVPDIFDPATATAYAQGYLSRSIVIPRHIQFRTRVTGLQAGQVGRLLVTQRNLVATDL